MSQYDLLIRHGTIVTATAILHADIAIIDGRFVTIEPQLSGTSTTEIDAQGLHIFPGVIDAHVHFNEPGRTEWEGFATGSRAIAAGGGTAFFEMPLNANPPTLDAASFDLKLASAQAASLVDFAFWGGLVPHNLAQLDELAERGVIGFKAFMSNSGIAEFPAVDDLSLYEGMKQAAHLGKIVAVHAESEQITSALVQQAQQAGKTGIRDYLASRPAIAELEAIQRAILFASETGCKLHIVHVSTGRGIQLVAEARARGVDVSCETCPHYLVFTEEDVEVLGAVAKCAPPLRSAQERETLWQHLAIGSIPMVASDHSPAPMSMKTDDNFFHVWGGISGCQSLLQLLLTEGAEKRYLDLTTIAAVTSEYIARRFALPNKGRIAPGIDADLALIDLGSHATLRQSDLFYKHRYSPYVGRTLQGRIVRTLVRGTTVFLDGKHNPQSRGKLIKPPS